MKASRWVYISGMILLLAVGAIGCAGPQSRLAKEALETAPAGEISRQTTRGGESLPPSASPEAPLEDLPGLQKAERTPLQEESPGRRVAGVPGPPRPASSAARPAVAAPGSALQGPAPNSSSPPAAPPQPAPGQPGQPPEARGSRFVLNFDNADIYEVIRVMAEMMNINYIVDPRVKGVVNIRTTGQISTKDIFPVFQAILNLSGATAVKRGIIYEIVPFGEAKKLSIPLSAGPETGRKPREEAYTIQIIALKYIPTTEASKMIKPFLSDGADIVEDPLHNILIVGDMSSNIQKTMDIVELFDVDVFAGTRVRFYPILNADANDLAKEMERIFSSLEVSVKSGRGVGITFTPVSRINSLMVVSSIPGIFEKVERWLKELDRVPQEGSQVSVFVYYVQNGKAKDLAEVLKQVYAPVKGAKGEAKEKGGATAAAAPGSRSVKPSPAGAGTPATSAPGAGEAAGVPEGEIGIVVDETTNSLIIRAYQRDYKAILETIKKLDIYPKQVLIEVLLAEVTLTDSTKFGLEFSFFTDSFTSGGRTYNYTIAMGGEAAPVNFSSGLRYAITSVDHLAAAVQASAAEDRLKVISSPHVLASNNKEARIQIGSSQPILTNTYTTTATAAPGVVEGTIEYKDIGIILTVTPRISDGKLVTMEVSIEQSNVGQTTLGNLSSVPFFTKKTAKTTLSITERQTIVIGGLIEDTKETGKSGVPFLSRIPILGALFGIQRYSVAKTETLMFLTPHVITGLEESNRITQEFKEKVYGIQKELEKLKQEKKEERKKDNPPKDKDPAPASSNSPASPASNQTALSAIGP
jgi:general secretion pathway protein D